MDYRLGDEQILLQSIAEKAEIFNASDEKAEPLLMQSAALLPSCPPAFLPKVLPLILVVLIIRHRVVDSAGGIVKVVPVL